MLHDVDVFYIYGDLPAVGSLTVIGTHQIIQSGFFGQQYTATCVYLERDVTLRCDVTLESLFLMSKKPVTVSQNGYSLRKGNDYCAVKDYIFLST